MINNDLLAILLCLCGVYLTADAAFHHLTNRSVQSVHVALQRHLQVLLCFIPLAQSCACQYSTAWSRVRASGPVMTLSGRE